MCQVRYLFLLAVSISALTLLLFNRNGYVFAVHSRFENDDYLYQLVLSRYEVDGAHGIIRRDISLQCLDPPTDCRQTNSCFSKLPVFPSVAVVSSFLEHLNALQYRPSVTIVTSRRGGSTGGHREYKEGEVIIGSTFLHTLP